MIAGTRGTDARGTDARVAEVALAAEAALTGRVAAPHEGSSEA